MQACQRRFKRFYRMYSPAKIALMMLITLVVSIGGYTVSQAASLEQTLAQQPVTTTVKSAPPADLTTTAKYVGQQLRQSLLKLKPRQFKVPKPTATKAIPYAGLNTAMVQVTKNEVLHDHNYFWPAQIWLPFATATDPDFWANLTNDDDLIVDEEIQARMIAYLKDSSLIADQYGHQTYGESYYQLFLEASGETIDPTLFKQYSNTMNGFQAWLLRDFAQLELGLITHDEVRAHYEDQYRAYAVLMDDFMAAIGSDEGILAQLDQVMAYLESDMIHQYVIKPMLDNASMTLGATYSIDDLASLDPEKTVAVNTAQYEQPALDVMQRSRQGQTWLTTAVLTYVQRFVMTNPAAIAAPVTVTYVDQTGTKIAADKKITGNLGDAYDATTTDYQLELPDYELDTSQLPTNGKGQLTAEAQTVTYVYTKKVVAGAPVTVHYQEASGQKLAPTETLTGNVGDTYQTQQKSFTDYTFASVTGQTSGEFTTKAQTVVYTYTKNPVKGAPVTVRHQSETGTPLAEAETIQGNIGDQHQTKAKMIAGYNLLRVEGEPLVTISADPQTVTYIYTPKAVAMGTVTIMYLDEAGRELAPATELTGKVGDDFNAEALTLTGYQLQTTPSTIAGQFKADPQTFKFTYQPVVPPVTTGQVLVRYVDEKAHDLVPATTMTGKLTTAYTTKAKAIKGYHLVKTTGPTTGTYMEQLQVVTYQYAADQPAVATGQVTVHYQDETGQALAISETLTGDVGTAYQTTLKAIKGYTYAKTLGAPTTGTFKATAQTVTYRYRADAQPIATGKVMVHYQDLAGKKLAATKTLTGSVGSAYATTAPHIKGYTAHGVTGKPAGHYTAATQTVIYRYQVKTTANQTDSTTTSAGDTVNTGTKPTTTPTKPTQATAAPTTKLPTATANQALQRAGTGKLPQANERTTRWPVVLGASALVLIGLGYWWYRRQTR
ncbi:MucBP domain-containing protein [Lactiplantibacillus daowaiensis]|uniref:MucBP domain-containing protein n=1 Tax=Lactiplantibacillus daowaiensis TaxID=2559918 RepID=A0ABW1S1K0_9LACO|nr:MucBP domain-containing protein [Lactiplantibacillus daowaiensis]